MERDRAIEEVARLRNRHVAKLLSHLGNDVAPYLAIAIKRALSMFAEDVARNIILEDQTDERHDAPVSAWPGERSANHNDGSPETRI